MPRELDWAAKLTVRFEEVARRRVPEEDVADIVQDALRVVHEKGRSQRVGDGPPPLPWCQQVLRNVIGNYYQRRRTRGYTVPIDDGSQDELTGAQPTPLEALETREVLDAIRASLAELSSGDEQCGRLLGRVLDGARARELASESGLTEPVLYRRLYRCRQKLRQLLRERGVIA